MLLTLGVALLAGCTERGVLALAQPTRDATIRDVWVVNYRDDLRGRRSLGEARTDRALYGRLGVSIPPNHEIGTVQYPSDPPNAETDYVVVNANEFETVRSFLSSLEQSDTSGQNETLLFVHGYNTTHGEAVYNMAQMGHDLDIPVPTLLFSWPSSAQARGYVYDRDSAVISRDRLEELIIAATQNRNRKLFLVAHSMGSYLLMETLRQIALTGSVDLAERVSGIILMAPDIDTEVFRAQLERIEEPPDPFLIVVTEQDGALRLSAWLTGRKVRLGSLSDAEGLEGLPVTLVDFSSLADGRSLNHKVATNSPAAIAFIRQINQIAPPGELNIVDSIVRADATSGGFGAGLIGAQ
ncbi:MAG: alpha/beta fold hydrolase [Pseudomonadota bacterium]